MLGTPKQGCVPKNRNLPRTISRQPAMKQGVLRDYTRDSQGWDDEIVQTVDSIKGASPVRNFRLTWNSNGGRLR